MSKHQLSSRGWLDRRRRLSPGARAPVFCTLNGGRVDASYVRHLLPRLAAKAGLDRRVHAHRLRHTYASELARERTPINVIRDALGHTSLAVTDRYLRDVAPMHVIDTIRARRWDDAWPWASAAAKPYGLLCEAICETLKASSARREAEIVRLVAEPRFEETWPVLKAICGPAERDCDLIFV